MRNIILTYFLLMAVCKFSVLCWNIISSISGNIQLNSVQIIWVEKKIFCFYSWIFYFDIYLFCLHPSIGLASLPFCVGFSLSFKFIVMRKLYIRNIRSQMFFKIGVLLAGVALSISRRIFFFFFWLLLF